MIARNEQEQTQSHNIHQSENQCRHIAASVEQLVGYESGRYSSDNTAYGTYRDDKR